MAQHLHQLRLAVGPHRAHKRPSVEAFWHSRRPVVVDAVAAAVIDVASMLLMGPPPVRGGIEDLEPVNVDAPAAERLRDALRSVPRRRAQSTLTGMIRLAASAKYTAEPPSVSLTLPKGPSRVSRATEPATSSSGCLSGTAACPHYSPVTTCLALRSFSRKSCAPL